LWSATALCSFIVTHRVFVQPATPLGERRPRPEFNRIIDSQKPPGLREIANAWNSGDWRGDIGPWRKKPAILAFSSEAHSIRRPAMMRMDCSGLQRELPLGRII
jgi:hypothetical protein